MKRYFLIATLACVGTGSMAINAQQGRMAQIVPPQATGMSSNPMQSIRLWPWKTRSWSRPLAPVEW